MMMAASVHTEPSAARHVPVMVEEALEAFDVTDGTYLDLTLGLGGHSAAILERNPGVRVIGFDRDPAAVEAARARFATFGDRAEVVHSRFGAVADWLRQRGIGSVDGFVADLGVSSTQLANPDRGMSFRLEGPLDMRMDPSHGETALELVERVTQEELADHLYHYGGERRSRRVARCVKQALESGELSTTLDLRRAVVRAVGPRRIGGVDPATRTFQALRIAVNRELGELEDLLAFAPGIVRPGGVGVVISFHSLEDRQVKRAFADGTLWTRLTKKPRIPGDAEREANPRSRSAKLRAARRNAESFTADERSTGGTS